MPVICKRSGTRNIDTAGCRLAYLSAQKLSIGYRRSAPVVQEIDFNFPATGEVERKNESKRGAVLGLVGPNGSGKTTFLKTCLGLLSPLYGELSILGSDTRAARFSETRKKLAYVPQNRPEGQSGRLRVSVREAVGFGRLGRHRLGGRFDAADYEAVDAAILYCGLAKLADTSVQDLSGGQFQRMSLARAIAAEPEFYFLDEPSSFLDAGGAAAVRQLLRSLAESEEPLIIATHDRELIALCDALVLFSAGTAQMLDSEGLRSFLSSYKEGEL